MSNATQGMAPKLIGKSHYITGSKCLYATYASMMKRNQKTPVDNELVFINGHEFKEAAVKYFGAETSNISLTSKTEKAWWTKQSIENGVKVIADASFIIDEVFCSIDILKMNDDNTVTVYEVMSGSEVKETDENVLAFICWGLKKQGYTVKEANFVYANKTYSFAKGETVDFEKLFVIKNYLEQALELEPVVENDIRIISDALKTENPPLHDFSSNCNIPSRCPFFEMCIKEAGLPEDTNIFKIVGPKFTETKLNKWYYSGIKTFEDVVENVEVKYKKDGTPKDASYKFVEQARNYLEKKDGPIKLEELGTFLEKIQFPLASFDYEGFSTAIPYYYGLKPNTQVVFQFSYDYIESEGAERQHFDFLAKPGEDPRYSLCKALAKLPKAKSILIWNKTYEANRNKEMAELEGFEKFKDMLFEMCDNFVDLMEPFKERVIMPWRCNGSYSLKPITEALIPNLQYKDLKVHNGTEAAEKFMKLDSMSDEDRKKCIQTLKMYNNQDTYGPLKILEKLYRIYKMDEKYVLFTDKSMKDAVKQELHVGDTVTCNKGIGAITKINDKYVNVMLMKNGQEIRRMGKSLVLVQEYVTDKPRNIKITPGTKKGDLVTCNKGPGIIMGHTRCFLRIRLKTNNWEILRARHNVIKIQDFIEFDNK